MEGTNDPEPRGADAAPPGAGAPPPPELEPSDAAAIQQPDAGGGAGFLGDVAALIQNRFILFGLGVLVVLLLLTIVLVVVGGGDDDNAPSVILPTTPGDDATEVRPLVGLPGRLIVQATPRIGPGPTYAQAGLIPQGALVPVVGRNEDGTWLQVLYPPNSQLRVWVIATSLDVDGDIGTLVLAGPGAGPQVPLPTSFPFLTPDVPVEETPALPGEEPTATEERPTRATRTPVPSATRIFVSTSTPPPEPTPAGQ
jgi:hypothetical protein